MPPLFDVVIAGGGVAGLSAALVLGRCRRSVLLCDEGHPRNSASHAVHCLLGNEGIAPADLLAKGRHELRGFDHVSLREDKVRSIGLERTVFTVTCRSGFIGAARKVLLTTGIKDDVPDIDGIEKFSAVASIIALIATDTRIVANRSPSMAKATKAQGLPL